MTNLVRLNQIEAVTGGLSSSSSTDPCAVAPVVGPCKGTFPRWYYDQNAGECKHFLYGGCQGNHNNFLQESDCVSECIQKSKGRIIFNPFVDLQKKKKKSEFMTFFWNSQVRLSDQQPWLLQSPGRLRQVKMNLKHSSGNGSKSNIS